MFGLFDAFETTILHLPQEAKGLDACWEINCLTDAEGLIGTILCVCCKDPEHGIESLRSQIWITLIRHVACSTIS